MRPSVAFLYGILKKVRERKQMKSRKKRIVRENLLGYSLVLPSLLGYMIFVFIPIGFAMVLSLMDWNGSFNTPMEFVGLKNFVKLFGESGFQISLKNTVFYAIFTVPLTLGASLITAILLNKKIKGMTVFRTAFFFPYIASIIAVGAVWNMLFQPEYGPINSLLRLIGIQNPPGWVTSTDWAMAAVIIVSIWKYVGYYMLVYLAGLQGISADLYEAAAIDGANGWEKFKNITLPMLRPTTFFVSIMLTIQCFKIFDLIYVMTQGGPGRSTNVLVYFIYNKAFVSSKFGYASAASMILFVLVLAVTLIQFSGEKKYSNFM